MAASKPWFVLVLTFVVMQGALLSLLDAVIHQNAELHDHQTRSTLRVREKFHAPDIQVPLGLEERNAGESATTPPVHAAGTGATTTPTGGSREIDSECTIPLRGEVVVIDEEEQWFHEALDRIKFLPSIGVMPRLRRWLAQKYLDERHGKYEVSDQHHFRLLRMVREYIAFQKQWVKQYGKVFTYLHFSKVGGTSFCTAMRSSMDVTQECHPPNTLDDLGNCHANQFDDGPRWVPLDYEGNLLRWLMDKDVRKPQHDACDERLVWMSKRNITFHMIESYLPGGEISPLRELSCLHHSMHIVTFRDPVDRLLSASFFLQWLAHVLHRGKFNSCQEQAEYASLLYNDNYVRAILGGKVYRKTGYINEEEFEQAKKLLKEFYIVINLKDMGSPEMITMIDRATGFNLYEWELGRGKDDKKYEGTVAPCNKEEHGKMLRELNMYDTQLAQIGYGMAELDLLFYNDMYDELERVFAPEGTKDLVVSEEWRQNNLPCCGDICQSYVAPPPKN